MTDANVPKMVSLRTASEKTGLSYECLRQLCINGEIVHMRSGVKYLVNLKKLEEYLDVGKGHTLWFQGVPVLGTPLPSGNSFSDLC